MAILACTPNEYAFSCLDSALVSEICLLLILLLETSVDALWLQCHSYSSEMQQLELKPRQLINFQSRVTVAERVYSLKPFLIAEKALKLLIGWILCKTVAARKLPLAFFQLSCRGSESKSF
ncbi:hypothetical protein SADUNF_Sadunf14G0001400 [Salix dunnii]|uniref:Uncharacterized protein n=1 Tax=Salix dunnii TaxID=1413687 RepID=A0A835JGS2_9ROSI|nr:hypothetical protein SADUNF_Sadunf14G0001400 [Salix dunnii]